jgi:hypothetical protein
MKNDIQSGKSVTQTETAKEVTAYQAFGRRRQVKHSFNAFVLKLYAVPCIWSIRTAVCPLKRCSVVWLCGSVRCRETKYDVIGDGLTGIGVMFSHS